MSKSNSNKERSNNTYLYKYDNSQTNNDFKVHVEMSIYLTSKIKYYMDNLPTKKNTHT